MKTGPEGVLRDILSSVADEGSYEVDSSILLSGVFGSEGELRAWAERNNLRYEMSDLPGQETVRKKVVTFYRSGRAAQ